MTVGSVVAAGSAGCEKCPYPGCTFAFDPERCTNKDADGEWCNQLFHHMCQTELEMEAWRKSTHNVDELIAARTGNPFESATTKICCHAYWSHFACLFIFAELSQSAWTMDAHVWQKAACRVEEEQLRKNNSELSIDDVAVWIESNKGLEGRFCWFETLARETNFYQKIARRLLSIGTVGSIDVERRAKGLKHEILSKARNRLSDDQAIIIWHVREFASSSQRKSR